MVLWFSGRFAPKENNGVNACPGADYRREGKHEFPVTKQINRVEGTEEF